MFSLLGHADGDALYAALYIHLCDKEAIVYTRGRPRPFLNFSVVIIEAVNSLCLFGQR
jgi:hypothetical protein